MFLSEDLVSFHLWEDIFETPYLQNNPPYLIAWNSRPVHWQIRSYPQALTSFIYDPKWDLTSSS